jgi:hypothetical protein
MLGVAEFDLWKREDVAEQSHDILKRLERLDAVRPGLARGAGGGLPSLGRCGNARVTTSNECF